MSDDPRSPWADDSGLDGEPTGQTPADLPSTPYDRPYEEVAEPPAPPPPPDLPTPPSGNEPTTMFTGGGPPSGPVPTAMAMPPPDPRRRWYNDKPAAAAAAGVGVALLFLMIAGLIWYFSKDDGDDTIATVDSSSTTTTTTTLPPTTTEAPTTTAQPTTTPAPTTTTTTPVVTVPPSPGSTTWDIIQVSPDFSRLEALISTAGYSDELDGMAQQFTILAPGNAAIERFDAGIGNDLNDPAQVNALIGSLIVRGSLTASNIYAVTELVMDNGMVQPVTPAHRIGTNLVALNEPPTPSDGIQTANGYLHVASDVPLANEE